MEIWAADSAPTRAAASSTASGTPSSLRHISATDPAFSGVNSKTGLRERARSTNSRADS